MIISNAEKLRLEEAIKLILYRVERAADSQSDTDNWTNYETNTGAPDGMDYWEWIDEAQFQALNLLDILR
jgi:hypothetical protein